MLEIEIHEEYRVEVEEEYSYLSHWVTINNIPDKDSWIDSIDNPKHSVLYLKHLEAFKELSSHTIADIKPYTFKRVVFGGFVDKRELIGEHDNGDIEVIIRPDSKNVRAPGVKWSIQLDSEHWNKPWSIKEFANELRRQIELSDRKFTYWQDDDEFVTSGFGIVYRINKEKIIQKAIDELEIHLRDLFDRTRKTLLGRIDEDALVTFFQFTDSTSVASKQYLIYFAQFLADLGIEADTELTQQTHNTLFKVIPRDKKQSLQQIKEALDVYLAASSMESLKLNSFLSESQDIAIQQWRATIAHLQGQLYLANAIISAKEAESVYLRETNLLYKNQLLLSAPESKGKVEQEEVIPGIVTVGEYDGNGVKINIARLVKMLKRKLGFGK